MMRNLIWKPIVLVLMLLVSGCAGIGAAKLGIQTDIEFNELVLEDVRQAKLLAEQTNDTLAKKCWTYIEEFTVANAPDVESLTSEVVGVLSAYQKARNLRRTVIEVEISDQFRLACGPMLTESMGALGRLGIRIGL